VPASTTRPRILPAWAKALLDNPTALAISAQAIVVSLLSVVSLLMKSRIPSSSLGEGALVLVKNDRLVCCGSERGCGIDGAIRAFCWSRASNLHRQETVRKKTNRARETFTTALPQLRSFPHIRRFVSFFDVCARFHSSSQPH
jgi:hypothetical protein